MFRVNVVYWLKDLKVLKYLKVSAKLHLQNIKHQTQKEIVFKKTLKEVEKASGMPIS